MVCTFIVLYRSQCSTHYEKNQILPYHPLLHITLPTFSDRVDTSTIVLSVDIMFARVLYGFLESSSLAKWDIEEFDSVFFCIEMPHFEELFEVFFGTGIQARGIVWDFESTSELGRDHHTHIIAIGTLFSSFWCMLDPANTRKKIAHIIRSFDIWDIFYLTHFDECLIALVVLRFWLDIWIVPKTYHIILVSKLEYRHRDIRPTADMDEDTRF